MKIIPGRTIVLTKFNGGLLGIVAGTYKKKLEVETTKGDYTEDPEHFVPICQLRRKVDLSFYTVDEIIERCKVGIMSALIKKAASLANEKDGLIEKLSKLNSGLGSGEQGED